ncbi:hypothetical protein SLOPH_2386, partial [Spraguea lophii 42_110]
VKIKKQFLDHLISSEGITFLVDKVREQNKKENIKNKNIEQIIDELLDFYKAWINNIPTKKAYKEDYYTIMKDIEEFCSKKENSSYFDYII